MESSKRYSNALKVLGPELSGKVGSSKVLCVGAGGIGCELLKNLVMVGFGNIEIVDLDTIDVSNLNRQFLFQKQHVKRPKATVAKETASKFNPNVSINALHANIKDPKFDLAYFKSFDVVLNALDNLDARRHVNKMCLAANVPLVESGTAGYQGQVQPIQKDLTECYDCQEKPTPKSFPVCTIRSTPSTPIHCIVWAKSYLFPQLFGPDDETDAQELDKALAGGENASEIGELKKEAQAMKEIRATLNEDFAEKKVFDKVFNQDINRLLKMEDMWRTRTKPTPLLYDELLASSTGQINGTASDSQANGHASTSTSVSAPQVLKDQKELSLQDSFDLFNSSFKKLAARAAATPDVPLDWDKDDDDALDFATAAANIRASIFKIPRKTRFDVKAMAGSIIPAIATTNAIVAGLLVLQALNVLRKAWSAGRMVWVTRSQERAMTFSPLQLPNSSCSVCRTVFVPLSISPSKLTLQEFVEEVLQNRCKVDADVSISEGSRVLYDPDFEDNLGKTLLELGVVAGSMLTVNDEDGSLFPIVFPISTLATTDTEQSFSLTSTPGPIPSRPPKIENKPEEQPEKTAPKSKRKRTASEAGLDAKDDEFIVAEDGVIVIDPDDNEKMTAGRMDVDITVIE